MGVVCFDYFYQVVCYFFFNQFYDFFGENFKCVVGYVEFKGNFFFEEFVDDGEVGFFYDFWDFIFWDFSVLEVVVEDEGYYRIIIFLEGFIMKIFGVYGKIFVQSFVIFFLRDLFFLCFMRVMVELLKFVFVSLVLRVLSLRVFFMKKLSFLQLMWQFLVMFLWVLIMSCFMVLMFFFFRVFLKVRMWEFLWIMQLRYCFFFFGSFESFFLVMYFEE